MKRFIYCALIALLTLSCNQNDNPWEDNPYTAPPTLYAHTPEFESRAVFEYQPEEWDGSGTMNSRTYAVVDPNNPSEYFQYWTEGNAISLFATTANLQYVLQSYKNGEEDYGIFEQVGNNTTGTAINTNYFYSVYPYKESTTINKNGEITYEFPATQHYNGDSYANGENGMVAIEPKNATDSILYFQNFCSYLQIRLTASANQSKTVKEITLTANNQRDAIAGQGTIKISSESSEPVVTMRRGATNQITLDCGSGVALSQDANNPTRFWFVLPGGFTFSEGFSITVVLSDDTFFQRSTLKPISIERSHIKPMATLTPIGAKPIGPIRYKYNGGDKKEPFPVKNTFYGEDNQQLEIIDQVYDEETGEWVILLSGTLKTIGDNSFEGPGPDIEYIKIDNKAGSEEEDVPPIILNKFAFYNTTADSIIINTHVESINESAFTGSSTTDLIIRGDVTTINNSAGTGSNIVNIDISGNVTTIDEQAFSGVTSLQTVNIGHIETIGYRAFYMCSNLTTVNIPGVKTLGMGAFRSCTSLTNIHLDSVKIIDDNAFMDCSSLTSVVISENCTMIGEGAFCNAVSLETVYCHAARPPFIKTDNYNSSYAFDNVHPNIRIYIPVGSEDYYINGDYFLGQKLDDPAIEAEVNWWYEEYQSMLKEKEF